MNKELLMVMRNWMELVSGILFLRPDVDEWSKREIQEFILMIGDLVNKELDNG